uniref:Shisa N-terminal domain-containing protein n=1 Tax=Monopterus albus TaxID=43700 RepID=A0A3Q3QHS8_MONAL
MVVTVLRVLSSLVCVLCVILLPAVWGRKTDYCSSYWDQDGFFYDTIDCGFEYCCGDCNKKYCCSEKKYQITQEQQKGCAAGPKVNISMILGIIFGCVVPIIFCVALVICCVAPCCLLYKRCKERRNPRPHTVISTTAVVGVPQQPLPPSGHQLSYPGYQPVPVQPGYEDPSHATAPPPSYLEAIDPAHFPGPFTQGHPTQPLGPPHAPSPHLEELAQPPYNPSYGLHP